MRLHLHRDPNWQQHGSWAYYQCRCGARRVKRVTINLMSPIAQGWPRPANRHGQPTHDSGWHQQAGAAR